MKQPPCEEQKRRIRNVAQAAARICPQYGLDPRACVAEAILLSSGGKHAIYHNYWNLHGSGDRGYVQVVKIRRVADAGDGGGVRSEIQKIARFSDDAAGVVGYCEAVQKMRRSTT